MIYNCITLEMERANLYHEAYKIELKEKIASTLDELIGILENGISEEDRQAVLCSYIFLIKALASLEPNHQLVKYHEGDMDQILSFELADQQEIVRLRTDGNFDLVNVSDDILSFNLEQQAAWLLYPQTGSELKAIDGTERVLKEAVEKLPKTARKVTKRDTARERGERRQALKGFREMLRNQAPSAIATSNQHRDNAAKSVKGPHLKK